MASASGKTWPPPKSIRYPRHLPVTDAKKSWKEVVAETGRRHGKARYGPHPRMTEAIIHQLEEQVVKDGLNDSTFELPQQKENVRSFWGEFKEIIGASNGEETRFVYVEYCEDGTVHGRPMTKQQLIQKGMKE